ncbi:M20/M25/M40 family metallo-hydrolase [Acetonema longum]|uniref:Peptidase T-like protein n=1 Tax=Acetonema longum DSM 6540 TaxID=1009370 RepID=F7NIX2_9FIRM|nr:M20/M25/M40 family metallo-hydrolase [Acetonema longum]EGO63969.1 peptidase T-like protein [Acetonema longum DSM 6540]
MINQQRLLAEFFEMVKIKCSTRAEREVADLIKKRLQSYGGNVTVTEDNTGEKIGGNCGNIIAYVKGSVASAPVVMFSAHMDCVEPCGGVEPVLKDGIITSAGNTVLGGDDKAGVVAIMEALRVAHEQKIPHGDIQIVFTVAEEGGLNGSKNMDPKALKADFGYALDSSGIPGKIIVKAPGQNKIEVVVTGKTAHAGLAPEEGLNAIVLAGKALAAIKEGRIDEETTANIGIIKGGGATNIVPDRVEIICEARSRNMAKLEAQTKSMVETFEQVVAANGGKTEISVKKAYGPYVLSENDPVVKLAAQAGSAVGLPITMEGTGGGSDANFFNSYGVPTAVLAVGMSKVHTTDEYIKEADLYSTAEWVLELIKQAAALKK